jgi:hypothetical protein
MLTGYVVPPAEVVARIDIKSALWMNICFNRQQFINTLEQQLTASALSRSPIVNMWFMYSELCKDLLYSRSTPAALS